MGQFTIVPEWIIQDVIILILAVITLVFIISHEKRPAPVVLEFICFILLYAAVFENFATLMGWYGYGRSVIMVFNVPITVPVVEYLVVYTAIRLGESMEIPKWAIPVFTGVSGVMFDFSLDPLAVSQKYKTLEGTIGRWSWYPGANDINIFNIPVYNFTGWFILCGFAAIFILLGRKWYEKSNFKNSVGMLYPPLMLIASLLVLVSPLSQFILWLGPMFNKGGITEYIMLGFSFVLFAMVLILWKGRMKRRLTFKTEYPAVLLFTICHASNIIFVLIGNHWNILCVTVPFAAAQVFLIWLIFRQSRKVPG